MPAIGIALAGAVISSAITLTPFVTSLALAAKTGTLTYENQNGFTA